MSVLRLEQGDCAEVMASMESNSVDAIITDPPYGLSFMGAEWDSFGTDTRQPGDEHYTRVDNPYGRGKVRYGYGSKLRDSMEMFQLAMTPIFEEALRVAKPGAHLLCFGGTRTFHRMACAIEDAGWTVFDCIMWVYGSGFPHGMDVGKAIDKALGKKREKVPNPNNAKPSPQDTGRYGAYGPTDYVEPTPATDAAAQWDGWGTCLKPAWEPIIVARKPLDGTVASNVLKWGTGALNIDACRVPTEDNLNGGAYADNGTHRDDGWRYQRGGAGEYKQPQGRFPANLVHDGSQMVLELFPDTGKSSGGGMHTRGTAGAESTNVYGSYSGGIATKNVGMGDSGSAARFFYCAKANKKDRGEGNDHPTVKPTELMSWLVRLVTPPGGVVLDPFMGSGSTGVAAKREGMGFIGIERDEHYFEIAKGRVESEPATLF